MSKLVKLFKALSISLALIFLSFILLSVKLDVWRLEALPTLIYQSGSYIRYGFTLVNYYSTIAFIEMLSFLTASFNNALSQALAELSNSYYNNIWMSQTASLPALNSMAMNLYYLGFQILLAAALLSLTLFILKTQVKYTIITFICLHGVITLAALLGNTLIGLTPLSGNPLVFFTNPVLVLTIISYFYLEVSFTYVHVSELFNDSSKRSENILNRITSLKTIRLPGENMFEATQVNAEQRATLFKLSNFIEKLERENPSFPGLISGESAVPDQKKLLTNFIVKSLSRALVILILVFICVNPLPILAFIAPTALLESVEFITPEITIILLLPIALLFPMLSLILSYRREKHTR